MLDAKTGEGVPGLYAVGELAATGGGLNVMYQGVQVIDVIAGQA